MNGKARSWHPCPERECLLSLPMLTLGPASVMVWLPFVKEYYYSQNMNPLTLQFFMSIWKGTKKNRCTIQMQNGKMEGRQRAIPKGPVDLPFAIILMPRKVRKKKKKNTGETQCNSAMCFLQSCSAMHFLQTCNNICALKVCLEGKVCTAYLDSTKAQQFWVMQFWLEHHLLWPDVEGGQCAISTEATTTTAGYSCQWGWLQLLCSPVWNLPKLCDMQNTHLSAWRYMYTSVFCMIQLLIHHIFFPQCPSW